MYIAVPTSPVSPVAHTHTQGVNSYVLLIMDDSPSLRFSDVFIKMLV